MMSDTELKTSWLPYPSALAFKNLEIAHFAGTPMDQHLRMSAIVQSVSSSFR